jgi:Na+/proline symporter
MGRSASDFLLADRRLAPWVFVVMATAMSFSGWFFLGQPALVFRDGLPFSETALAAVAIPLIGVLFLKRQWLLGRRFGYNSAADLFGHYFGGETIRLLVLLIGLCFAIPFVGMQLSATGYLIQYLSDGAIDGTLAMWGLTFVLFLYVCIGGMRGAAYAGTYQGLLLAVGIVALGLVALEHLGGMRPFIAALGRLGRSGSGPWGVSANGDSAYLSIPGVIQFTPGLGRGNPVGGVWTTSMILSYVLALMGLQASPAFTIWGMSCSNVKGFAAQQVWASAALMGLILVFFPVVAGLGAHFLGTSQVEAGLTLSHTLPALSAVNSMRVALLYIAAVARSEPWFGALLAVCALAAIQAMTAAFVAATATMFARDICQRYFDPYADDRRITLYARLGVGLSILGALLLATYAPGAQGALGVLALSLGLQLVPALAAVCWLPWITRPGVLIGLFFGMAAVVLTEPLGGTLARFMGFELPWGRWPWTIYSAGWGIFVNVLVCLVISWISHRDDERAHRQQFHDFLRGFSAPGGRRLRALAWAMALAWLFFAVGPGALIGNEAFGAPDAGPGGWSLGLPSLWAWQLVWWALGVLMIWFLAYKMELSTITGSSVEFAPAGSGDYGRASAVGAVQWRRWFWSVAIAAAVVVGAHWIFG